MKKVAGTHLKWTPYFMLSVASKAELRFRAHKQPVLQKEITRKGCCWTSHPAMISSSCFVSDSASHQVPPPPQPALPAPPILPICRSHMTVVQAWNYYLKKKQKTNQNQWEDHDDNKGACHCMGKKVFGSNMVKPDYLNNFHRRWTSFRGFLGSKSGLT